MIMLSGKKTVEFLQSTDLFAKIPERQLRSICGIVQEVDYPPGHILCHEGDLGDSLYLLVGGEVALIKGTTQVMTFRHSGDCIGEMALIASEPRSATLKTTVMTKLLVIERDDLFRAMAHEPSISDGMFSVLTEKLRRDLDVQTEAIRKEISQQESMRLAVEVQRSLLPSEEINQPTLISAGYCEAAEAVGGDYFDYFRLSRNRFAIFLGDVMGHGFHSAMLMAMTKSCIKTQIEFDSGVRAVMTAINRIVEREMRAFIFLTGCYVIIDLSNQKFAFANAGHPSMLHYRAESAEVVELESQVLPFGLQPKTEGPVYDGEEAFSASNDILVLYSDGITETENPDEELYGIDRLKNIVLVSVNLAPAEIKKAILEDLRTYRAGARPGDDLTLVVLKWR